MMHTEWMNMIQRIGETIFTVFMFMIAVIFILPFANMILTTFKEDQYIYDPFHIPSFTYLENYRKVFEFSTIHKSIFVTIVICAVTLAFIILISSLAGYRTARSKGTAYKLVFSIFAMTLIIPTQTNMVTLFKMGTTLHLINTVPYLVLIYLSSNVGYTSLIYYAFTKSIPRELEEAALIDGCGKLRTFAYVIFPLLMPASGTVLVTEIFWYWNDFQNPLIYLSGSSIKTVMLEVYNFKDNIGTSSYTSTQWGPVTAICFLSIIPILIFFLFTQKHLIKGLNVGAVKG